jgi:CelD/BcsL family acetyltransferase involved in cellulose biosynthesis
MASLAEDAAVSRDDSMAPATLELTTAATQEELDALAPEWDALVRAMPRPSPFLLHGWISAWWREYGDGSRLAVHLARRDGRLVGALPLFTSRRLGLRVTSFLGGGDSVFADVLLADGESPDVASRLADAAAGMRHDLACLSGLPAESRLAAALGPARLRLQERIEAPVLDLSEGWDAVYRAKTDAQRRKLHRRRLRQLGELGVFDVATAATAEDLHTGLEEAFELHESRWHGRHDTSGFASPAGRRFHHAATAALAADAIPRILTLRLDGRPIAFQFYLAFCERMYMYRLAFDPAFARYSPGILSMLQTLERAAADGLTTVEFLGGGEPYKAELCDRFAPLYDGIGLARTPQGAIAAHARLGAIRLRRRLKQSDRLRRLYFERSLKLS